VRDKLRRRGGRFVLRDGHFDHAAALRRPHVGDGVAVAAVCHQQAVIDEWEPRPAVAPRLVPKHEVRAKDVGGRREDRREQRRRVHLDRQHVNDELVSERPDVAFAAAASAICATRRRIRCRRRRARRQVPPRVACPPAAAARLRTGPAQPRNASAVARGSHPPRPRPPPLPTRRP